MSHTTKQPLADWNGARRLRFDRRGLILAAMSLSGAGIALNWGWLTAVGAAPLVLALAPCAVMCGLGLCMKGGSRPGKNENDPAAAPDQLNE